MARRGERYIDGKVFILSGRFDFMSRESADQEADAIRRRGNIVRIVRAGPGPYSDFLLYSFPKDVDERPDHTGEAGFLYTSKKTGATVYVAAEQGVDAGGDRYAVICEHGGVIGARSKVDARLVANWPGNFCAQCEEKYPVSRDLLAEALDAKRES